MKIGHMSEVSAVTWMACTVCCWHLRSRRVQWSI